MYLKGAGKTKFKPSFSQEDLYKVYQRFEKNRIKKAEKQLGRKGVRPDPFAKFIIDRTDICPHKLISLNTSYWIDTVLLFDGEQGLSLPCDLDSIPALFFDALGIVRSARAEVRKEETK